jgi:histidine phosphotransferase ChpT
VLDPIHLSSLIGSRICHDLISPIGAISNGVELMMMDSAGASGQEMALILESAGHANARIRYFRVAFGLCGFDQRIGRGEVTGILADNAAGGRVSVAWDSPQDLARRDVKMAFLGLMCLETALIQGGEVQVRMDETGWTLTARAPRIRRDPALWDGLTARSDALEDTGQTDGLYADVTAGQVHFPLLMLEAARQHRAIFVDGGEGEIGLRF